MNLFGVIISLEMLFVNLLTTNKCSKKKYSPALTWGILIVLTALLFAVMSLITGSRPDTGYGNGLLVFMGFVYIIPLYFLFDHDLKETILIMCSSWIYTMLVFSFSVQVGSAFASETPGFYPFLIQTAVYSLTLHFFLKFVQNRFIKIMQLMDRTLINRTLVISFLWFLLIVVINYTWVMDHNLFLELSILLFLSCIAILTYLLFYSLVTLHQRANNLERKTLQDQLTGLKNRESLYEDMRQRIISDQRFTTIFMDLDNFKLVNDAYGHRIGDRYLCQFVGEVQKDMPDDSVFYRLSGDEFVILYNGEEIDAFCETLKTLHFIEGESGIRFQGLSLGFSRFPVDADEISDLLHLADEKMYQVKKITHRRNYALKTKPY